MSELGAYYVTIVPSMRGAARQIEAELRGVDASAAGQTIGQNVSKAVGTSLNFQAVGQRLQDIGGQMTSLGGKLTRNITLPATIAATAVGSIAAAAGWKRLVGIDTARGQFKGLGFDADAVMKQVAAGLEGTAISMQDGAALAVGALATGNLELKDLEAQLQRVSNVSAAYGLEASHAGYLLNNVLTKNKVEWGDLSQMQQNQIPIVTALADHYGVAADQIQKMAQDGKISVEDLNAALDGSAGDAAEAYADTWQGVRDNIMANVSMISAAMQEGAFDELKAQAQDFLAFLETDEVREWAVGVGESITNFVIGAVDAIRSLIGWWTSLSGGTQKAILAIAGIAVVAGPVLVVIGSIITAVGKIIAVGGVLVKGISAAIGVAKAFSAVLIANPIGLVIAAVVALATGLIWFFSQTEIGQQIWQTFMDWLVQAWEFVKEFLTALWTGISESLIAVWEGIKNAVITAVDFVRDFIVTSFNTVLDFWTSVWTSISEFFSNIWNNITTFISVMIAAVLATIQSNVQNIQNIWNTVWSAISTFFSGIWNNIRTFVTNAINTIRSTITNVINTIRGTWNSVWSGIRSFFSNIWNTIVSAARGFMSSVQGTFQNVITFVSNIPSRILGFFSNMGSLLLGAGRSLLDGFLSGIRAGFDKVRNFVSDGISSIRNFFPFSPAKEGAFSGSGYTLHSGQALMEDFAKGISDASPETIAEMSAAAEAIARETDLSAAIPDFLPADWTASMVPAGVGGSPANARFAASQGATQSAGTTVQMTNEFTQSDPNEAVAIMWGTLRSAIRSNGGGDIGANPNA